MVKCINGYIWAVSTIRYPRSIASITACLASFDDDYVNFLKKQHKNNYFGAIRETCKKGQSASEKKTSQKNPPDKINR